MKAFLMYRDRDFDLQQEAPPNEAELLQDLELNTLFDAMAAGDKFIFEVVKRAVLSSLVNPDAILYRQDILKDCLKNPALIREIYDIAVESIASEKKMWWGSFGRYPPAILDRGIDVLQMFVVMLKKLRKIADEHVGEFESEGFRRFFSMLMQELSDDYFASIQNHLKELKFHGGVLISAELGEGNKGFNYVLRKSQEIAESWVKRILAKKPPAFSFTISDRDEAGARALSELKNRGINLVANALAQSTDHILSFFNMLRIELAFYVGCLNLREQLARIGEPISFPQPLTSGERRHDFIELYDICLALTTKERVVGNDLNADGKNLVVVTGANQGGKSTFLRSIGLSQMMMQCGMFVPAESFSSNVCEGLFTHYKREEDASMDSGKLDEELSRMSAIVDHTTSNSMLLFNESFAATNDREGSEIASQIVRVLLENHLKVFFVTHLYEFAHGFYQENIETAMFLRAERQPDGRRTFKIIEGEPLQTSYGQDLYNRIFANDHHKSSIELPVGNQKQSS
jgi:DNA mismatch repair ATPase MutS